MSGIKRIAFAGAFAFMLLMASGCNRQRHIEEQINSIEAYLDMRPDSALISLRAVDTTLLRTRSLRARYLLLMAIALDKNRIDTTDIGVVKPAVQWYEKRGTADQRMKAYYYLGRIQENSGNLPAAAVSFSIAEEFAEESEDYAFRGLLDLGIANVFRKSHNVSKTLEFTERGKSMFERAGDTSRLNLVDGRLAMAYQENHEWGKADSMYQSCMQLSYKDTLYHTIYLSQYAMFKLIQPDPDPEGAIELLNRRRVDYGKPLTMKDYGVYALASALLGDYSTCDSILEMLGRAPQARRKEVRYFEYRIAELRQEDARALRILKSIYSDQDTVVTDLLNHSVSRGLQEHAEQKAAESEAHMKRNRLLGGVSFLVLGCLSLTMILWVSLRRRKEREETEEILRAAEEANRLLNQSNAEMVTEIGLLRNDFVQFYREELERIGSLCEAFIKAKDRKDDGGKAVVYRRVERIVETINQNEESHARFKEQVNYYLNNAVDNLINDLSKQYKVTQDESRFICYSIAGFNSNTIAMLLGISLTNVYARRSRMRDKIRHLNSPFKEQYLIFFRDNR